MGGHLASCLGGTPSPVPATAPLCSHPALLLPWWDPQELQGALGLVQPWGEAQERPGSSHPISHCALAAGASSLLGRPHVLPRLLMAVLLLQKQGLNPGLSSEMLAGTQVPFTALQVLLTPALPLSRGSHLNYQSDVTGANGVMPSDHGLFLWLNSLKRDQNL